MAATQMLTEARESPDVLARQFAANEGRAADLGARLRALDPTSVVVCGRGSSDCAGMYAKYMIETQAGVVTAQMAPSVSSVYGARLKLARAVMLVISQSGKSPDLVASAAMAKEAGALVIAIVNDESSPLALAADAMLPLCAGPERSVAATKTFIASLASVAQLVTHWTQAAALHDALARTPDLLRGACEADWSAAAPVLRDASSAIVLSRGLCLAATQEAALKLKETSAMHAEAYSSAEVRHGPMAMLRADSPVLAFVPSDASGPGVEETLTHLARSGAQILRAGAHTALPIPSGPAPIEPLLFVQAFYKLASDLAQARGRDPDRPPALSKVTETV